MLLFVSPDLPGVYPELVEGPVSPALNLLKGF
jgi:hypothetical protein